MAMEKEKIVFETLERLKRIGVDTTSQLEIVAALADEINYYRERIAELESAVRIQPETAEVNEDATPDEAPATEPEVVYLCDHRACEKCNGGPCKYTRDIRHARNFAMCGGTFVENGEENLNDYYSKPAEPAEQTN